MRGKKAVKKKIKPDPKFNNANAAKFINYIMERGKKNIARDIFYGSLDIISEKTKDDGLHIFEKALKAFFMYRSKGGRASGSYVKIRSTTSFFI